MEKEIKKLVNELGEALTSELWLRQMEEDVKVKLKAAHAYTLYVEDELRQLKKDMLQFEHGRTTTIEGQTEEDKTSTTKETPERGGWFDAESWEAQEHILNFRGKYRSDASLNPKKCVGNFKVRLGKSDTADKRTTLPTSRI